MAPVAIGGLGLGGVALMLLLNVLTGGEDSSQVLNELQKIVLDQQNTQVAGDFEGEDEYEVFASTVLGSNNDTWEQIFLSENKKYNDPRLVLFRTATESACGGATSQVGPHYCPTDKTIYLDETFFDELTDRFGARGGDVAESYVIAHEVGHHVQQELGVFEKYGAFSNNDVSVRMELQADCFAGLWANSVKYQGVFEPGEIEEAIDAAAAVGDDRIQEKVTGYINPETWTHGSSEERVMWFNRGYEEGDLSSCDTFSGM